METLLLGAQEPGDLEKAAEILKNGGLAAIPTETVYGLAADAFNERAVRGIFAAKGRPADNPLIVHISDMDMMGRIAAEVPAAAYKLAERYWPGPLTIIMKKRPEVPYATSGGLDTVAIRFPSHPAAHRIIELAGTPLAAPSANLSGSPSPTTFRHCVNDLMGRVDAIVDGGPCSVGVESTVITLAGERPVLLRPGYVTLEQLRDTLGEVELAAAVLEKMADGEVAASPGMKYKHYAPKARVSLIKAGRDEYVAYVNERAGDGVFALCFSEDEPALKVKTVCYGSVASDKEQAAEIFDALRKLDDLGAARVYAHSPEIAGVGMAVYNRLVRAAGFDIITLPEDGRGD